MYTISRIAELFSISRATLLYYDSIGLFSASRRSQAGYRLYSEEDRNRLQQIRQLRELGIPVTRIRQYLAGPNDSAVAILLQRVFAINDQVNALRDQQKSILTMLEGEGSLRGALRNHRAPTGIAEKAGVTPSNYRQVHRVFEKASPDSHRRFLRFLGFSGAQIRELLKNTKKS